MEEVGKTGGNRFVALVAVTAKHPPATFSTYLFGVQNTGHVWMLETIPRAGTTLQEHEAWVFGLQTQEVASRLREA